MSEEGDWIEREAYAALCEELEELRARVRALEADADGNAAVRDAIRHAIQERTAATIDFMGATLEDNATRDAELEQLRAEVILGRAIQTMQYQGAPAALRYLRQAHGLPADEEGREGGEAKG
jgi:hypothetical protein